MWLKQEMLELDLLVSGTVVVVEVAVLQCFFASMLICYCATLPCSAHNRSTLLQSTFNPVSLSLPLHFW